VSDIVTGGFGINITNGPVEFSGAPEMPLILRFFLDFHWNWSKNYPDSQKTISTKKWWSCHIKSGG
jgi:hypothetical protein